MKLSIRLQTIANFVKRGKIVADIGTDHAYIPIYLVEHKIIKKAFALDINKGPLEKANENIKLFGFEEIIITRLSNGLDKLKANEVDTIIISGMGGELIIDILERKKEFFTSDKTFILSPHTKLELVRRYLIKNGFYISREDMCIDEGKYYTVIEAGKTDNFINYRDTDLMFGKYLIDNKNPILLQFLQREKVKYESIVLNKGLGEGRREEIVNLLSMIKETIDEMH